MPFKIRVVIKMIIEIYNQNDDWRDDWNGDHDDLINNCNNCKNGNKSDDKNDDKNDNKNDNKKSIYTFVDLGSGRGGKSLNDPCTRSMIRMISSLSTNSLWTDAALHYHLKVEKSKIIFRGKNIWEEILF